MFFIFKKIHEILNKKIRKNKIKKILLIKICKKKLKQKKITTNKKSQFLLNIF